MTDPIVKRVLDVARRLRPAQDQRALSDQLYDLATIARACGMYDAADFLSESLATVKERKR